MNITFFFTILLLCITLRSAEPFRNFGFQAFIAAADTFPWHNDTTFFCWCGDLTYKEYDRVRVGNRITIKPYLNRVYKYRNKIGHELFERWYSSFMKLKMGDLTEQELIETKTEMRAVVDVCDKNVV